MRKRLLIGATVLSLLGVLGPAIAGAAPTPSYSVTCVVGGNTTAKWQRVSLSQVTFQWFAPAGSATTFDPVTVPVTSKAHRGSAFSTTEWSSSGINPATVTVTFTHADGTTDQAEAACS